MRFSIIVPVYNTALYLKECIDSVLRQEFNDWELIIVDDGSTDGSGELADEYAMRDSRICVIHQNNKGQFRARQTGLDHAQGEYVMFLDSDDYWREDCLDLLDVVIDEHGTDVVMFTAKRFGDDKRQDNVIGAFTDHTEWCDKDYMYRMLISGNDYNSLCLKAMKRSLFDGDTTDYSKFDGFSFGEDKAQLLYPITKAETIIFIPCELYYYRYNPESAVHAVDMKRIPYMMADGMFELVYAYAKKWGIDDAEGHELMAVYYLRQFIQTFYMSRKSCKTKEDRARFRSYPWKETFDRRAAKYVLCKKLSLKEKIKLAIALFCVYL